MNSSNNTDIRQQEQEIFASMAKVRQPMAPDSAPPQSEEPSSLGYAAAFRARMQDRFPSLTDSDLDELLI
jgi:hypothetical protein